MTTIERKNILFVHLIRGAFFVSENGHSLRIERVYVSEEGGNGEDIVLKVFLLSGSGDGSMMTLRASFKNGKIKDLLPNIEALEKNF